MKRALSAVCLLALLSVLIITPISPASAKEPETLIAVKVVDVGGKPIAHAYVTFWNHSTTPSTMVDSGYTDIDGVAVFSQPDYVDDDGQGAHLSVMVSAPGYAAGSWHWSVEQLDKNVSKMGGMALPQSISVTLGDSSMSQPLTQQIITPMYTPPGTIRHRLVWWDDTTYANRLTTVAIINQVGYLESSFGFRVNISTKLEVKRKVDLGIWESAGEVTRGRQLGSSTAFTWTLPASRDDSIFRQRICQTQYDYRLEEYAIEQYQDNGDTWVWVRIGTEYKYYARQLNPNATADGYIEAYWAAPSATWTGNRLQPEAGQSKSTSAMDEIEKGFSATVVFMQLNLSVKHTTEVESVWEVRNTDDPYRINAKSYERGNGENKAWVWRP